MAQQGLFTAGTSIEELLEKRNTRANALQQSLMANAAQGARDPMKAQAFSLLGSSLGRALAGGMKGGQDEQMDALIAKNTEQKRLQGEFGREFTSGTPESNIQTGGELIKLGYVDYGSKLLAKGEAGMVTKQEKLAEQKRREGLIAAAKSFNLDAEVELLQSGGDLDEAAAAIRSQEEIGIAEKKGRGGKLSLAKVYNKGPAFMKEVGNGIYDSMDPTTYVNLLKGKKADLTSFVNSEGISTLMSVDETGKVFDSDKNLWVNPSELGLNVPSEGEGERLKTEFTQTQGLRNELAKDINYSTYKKVQLEFSKVLSSSKADSAAGDLSLIFAYMRMLDPTSVVRESEQQTAENARGLGDKVYNMYNKLKTGEKMGLNQRQEFVEMARFLYKDTKTLAQPTVDRIRDITKRYELNEEDVFGKLTNQQKILNKLETINRNDPNDMKAALEKLSQEERKTLQKMIADGEF